MLRSALLLALLLLAGCAGRASLGPDLATQAGWRWEVLATPGFDLASARRAGTGETAVIYLEGDGLAYLGPAEVSPDPTPTDPLALRLALAHPAGVAVGWLGRPCQYVMPGRNCAPAVWTAQRFSPTALAAMEAGVTQLKARLGARRLVLVGYSGGGALAALLAARREDVAALVTVAANLDMAGWLAGHRLPPMTGALDPAREAAPALGRLPQWHFSGAEDRVTGATALRGFALRLPAGAPARFTDVPGFGHTCCWARDWPRLLPALP